jgi:glutathione S-transferase
MAEYKLYCFAQSGNAFKAALMLNVCGAKWEPRFVDFFGGETRTPAYRENINEMGEVPVLEHGAKRLSQTGVILHYLSEHFGRFAGASGDEKREVLRWILWDNHKLTSYAATYRFLRNFANKEGAPETEFMKGRMIAALKVFHAYMAQRDWVAASRPTIADISICGYLFWPRDLGVDWDEYPAIGAWLKRIQSLENWAAPEALLPSGPASA